MRNDLTLAFRSFELLSRDYEEVLEYVHPDHLNLDVHSHRIFGLLLRACTDFEALSKAASLKMDIAFDKKTAKINTFAKLPAALGISELEVEIISFQPTSLFVAPLGGWSDDPHGLTWYRAYNEAKHNRVENFRRASLMNLSLALSACFLLLVGSNAIPATEPLTDDLPDGRKRINFYVGPFAILAPSKWKSPNYWTEP